MSQIRVRLDQLVLDIEFLLISVIQGVALAALAGIASPLIVSLQIESWLYIVSAFLFILVFWSHAIIHAISFIDWPLDLTHSFLYFLVSFFEVVAFSQMSHPLGWFGILTVNFIITAILYRVDLGMITRHEEEFSRNPHKKALYDHILSQHTYELKTVMPIGIVFHAIAFFLIWQIPEVFITQKYHVVLIFLQVLFAIATLNHALTSFKVRRGLISATID